MSHSTMYYYNEQFRSNEWLKQCVKCKSVHVVVVNIHDMYTVVDTHL